MHAHIGTIKKRSRFILSPSPTGSNGRVSPFKKSYKNRLLVKSGSNSSNRKWSVKRTVLISSLLILLTTGFFLYYNFNRLLTRALNNSFNASLLSDVYELKFENLLVNPFEGTIRVSNVTLQPREKPLHHYPYINSSFRLDAKKLTLLNVKI